MTRKQPLRILFLLLMVAAMGAARGQNYTISGTIIDKETGETLIGATVIDALTKKGTVTNAHGRYSLTLPKGTVQLKISYVGFNPYADTFALTANREVNVSLQPSLVLQEVVVESERINSVRSSQVSAVEIPVEHIKAVPVIFGETDILKVVQLLPGVQSGSEGTSGIYVRGGGPDENLFLLDGVPLYNVNHLGGFFSAFNSDAVKNVTLYKGSFPARFGGRLSSVLDVTTNNGNDKKIHGNASIGVISAKVNVEGPIIKERTTFNLSLRRTYLDAITQPFIKAMSAAEGLSGTTAGYYFYDFNGKITHKFSDRSRLYLSHYMGDDKVYFRLKQRDGILDDGTETLYLNHRFNWGNIVSSARWNYELTPKLFMNVTGAYTRYRNIITMALEETREEYSSEEDGYIYYNNDVSMSYRSGIQDWSGKVDFDYAPNPDHTIKFGGSYLYHIFTPEVLKMTLNYTDADTTQNEEINKGNKVVHAHEISAYAEDDWAVNEAMKLNAGVHMSAFKVGKAFYPSVQPRLSGRFILTDDLSVKAGYAYMTQYMHLLSNSNISLPTDLWVPVTENVKPMKAHQVAGGVFYTWHNLIDFSVECYYKWMNNLLEYKDGASFFNSSMNWEEKVAIGSGRAYGVEFLAQKNVGKFTGWIGYTWSKTTRLFDRPGMELNNGERFPAKYDRRHDISIVGIYKINDRIDVSATWVYSTGNATTLAMHTFYSDPYEQLTTGGYYDLFDNYTDGRYANYIESRNNYRMPAYHRMDLGVNFHKQKRFGERTINISVYNVYNRNNPYLVFPRTNSAGITVLKQVSLFPIIPSISYSYKF